MLGVGGGPKVKIGVTRTDIFCTKSVVLEDFINGHHVESFLKCFLSSFKCFKQKIWSKIPGPLGVLTPSKFLDPKIEFSILRVMFNNMYIIR